MSDIRDLMNARRQRATDLNLERLRSIASRANTATQDAAVLLPIDSIIVDDSIQVRVGRLNADKVESYAEALKAGAEFPPVDVFRDGDRLYLADGFHRLAAHQAAGVYEILAVVRPGGYPAAYEHAEQANLEHGLELTLADKKHIYMRRMARGYWDNSDESLRQIARAFGVNASTISRWRQEFETGRAAPEQGVANATLSEDYAKAKTAGSRNRGGRKPAKKQPLTGLQKRQRALKYLRAAAEAFSALDELAEADFLAGRADEWAAHWRMK